MIIATITIGKTTVIERRDTGWGGNDARLVRAARAIATSLPSGYYPDRPASEARYVARRMGGQFKLLRQPPPADPDTVY